MMLEGGGFEKHLVVFPELSSDEVYKADLGCHQHYKARVTLWGRGLNSDEDDVHHVRRGGRVAATPCSLQFDSSWIISCTVP